MPPPKKPAKKDEKADDGNDPILKNEVIFNIDFEIYHEKGHYVKLKYTWMNKDTLLPEVQETEYLKDWEVIKRDGEDQKQEQVEPPKDDKKKAAPKDPKKAGLEEIDDPVPTTVKLSKRFEDNPFKFTEEAAHKWSEFVMRVDVYEYDREANVDKLRDSVDIDLSFFLFPSEPTSNEWEFETLKVYSVNYLKVNISSNNALLSEFLRKKLNPLQIFILAAKDVPFKTDPKFKPIYTVCKFVDGRNFQTRGFPQSDF